MNLNIGREWLLRMAEKEGNGIVSVGGLVARIDPRAFSKPAPMTEPAAWSRLFPLKDMKRLRFSLPKGLPDFESLLGFFGVGSPEGWLAGWSAAQVAYRQTQVFDARQEAVAAWVREAEIIASQIPLADFDEALLRSSLDKLRRLTRKPIDEALTEAQLVCAHAGVAMVMVPELPRTRLSGCARWLDDKHALVGLTSRYRKDDQIWFTFFHEIGHILLHRECQTFVVDNAAENLSDAVVDPDMAVYEKEANRFAADTLIPPDALAEFVRRVGKAATSDDIHDFADDVGVGPGIVVGRLQHDGVLHWHQGNALKQTLNWDFPPEG
jgi:HTH-type transcriptional regulator/antitoxin HigA